ncbi:MAG: hypothetical protein AAF654_06835 [Myxococcota bacterium]
MLTSVTKADVLEAQALYSHMSQMSTPPDQLQARVASMPGNNEQALQQIALFTALNERVAGETGITSQVLSEALDAANLEVGEVRGRMASCPSCGSARPQLPA